jgi:hypothetical protein
MNRYVIIFLLLLFFPVSGVLAQGDPEPTPDLSSPLFESGPGIPAPFDIPEPDPENNLDVAPLWEYQSLSDAISAFLTIWVLADNNMLIQVALISGLVALVVLWMSRLLGRRSDESV